VPLIKYNGTAKLPGSSPDRDWTVHKMNDQSVKLQMMPPVVIAQAEAGERRWGYHQFPSIEKLPDGRLHVRYHIQPDSARAYGLEKGHALSADGGQSWTAGETEPVDGGLVLANGDHLRIRHLPSTPADQTLIGQPPILSTKNYSARVDIYEDSLFPEDMNRWPLERKAAGENHWKLEMKSLTYPGSVRYTVEGVLPWRMFWRLRQAPDQSVWAIAYPFVSRDGGSVEMMPLFFRSTDCGHQFSFVSQIPYQPDPTADPLADKRGGFTEPDIAFLPDGSIFCLLRTTDGHGIGPLYSCRSTDGGLTWSQPVIFDDLGVWPTLLTLDCGATLAVYGRPGIYLRLCTSSDGTNWSSRQMVVRPLDFQTDTCSYADMIALSASSLYLVYSDFNYPNAAGVPVKTILGREICLL
jgi:hypothetical protein